VILTPRQRAFRAAVLMHSRELIELGQYPSGRLLKIRMPGRHLGTLIKCRDLLIEKGELDDRRVRKLKGELYSSVRKGVRS
jgi:hypothetical protein